MINFFKIVSIFALNLVLFTSLSCFSIDYSIKYINLEHKNSFVSSINQNGDASGKIEAENSYYYDFIYSAQDGFQQVDFRSSSSLPFLNNHDQIAGVGWFTSPNWYAGNERYKYFYSTDKKGVVQSIDSPTSWPVQKLDSWYTDNLWDNNQLGVLGINDSGLVLVSDFFESSRAKRFAVWHPVSSLWSSGYYKEIDNQKLSQAFFINKNNIVLGKNWEKTEQGSIRNVALYDLSNDSITSLFTDLGYTLTGFNDKGQICGWKMAHLGTQIDGFLWDPEKGLQSLGDFIPFAINNNGQMVGDLKTEQTNLGYYGSNQKHAISKINDLKFNQWTPCIWLDDHPITLKDIINTEKMPFTAILNLVGINDKGEIIGHALIDHQIQAIFLTPIIESQMAPVEEVQFQTSSES